MVRSMPHAQSDDLATSLHRFGLERDRFRAALARRARIGATDLDALEHLEADGPLTQRELGDRLALTSGAVTMLVDRLEEDGWVHRRPHPHDRRAVLLELSATAERRAPEELVRFHEAIDALAGDVSAEHRTVIRGFLLQAADAAARAASDLGEDRGG